MSEIKDSETAELTTLQKTMIRFCSPAIASVVSTTMFYPLEKAGRLIQVHQGAIFNHEATLSANLKHYAKIGFGGAYPVGISDFFTKTYRGLSIAIGYKCAVRTLKYGGQPLVKEALDQVLGEYYDRWFGENSAKIWLDGTAGVIVGVNEAALLLPIDMLKIRRQVNPDSIEPGIRGLLKCARTEKFGMWRGVGPTALRNSLGCASFFSSYAVAKNYFSEGQTGSMTTVQRLAASTVATAISMLISAPVDRVKSRMVSRLAPEGQSSTQVFINMVRKEGFLKLWSGTGLKLASGGPQTITAINMAMALSDRFTEELINAAKPIIPCPSHAKSEVAEAPRAPITPRPR